MVENDLEKGIMFEFVLWVDYCISKDLVFEGLGEGWVMRYLWGIVFDGKMKYVVYNISDIGCFIKGVFEVVFCWICFLKWKDVCLVFGIVVVMCGWGCLILGIFMLYDVNIFLLDVKVYYVEGMGLLV